MTTSSALGFYLHVPFCASRCGYCDFNTYTASELGRDAARISKDSWSEFAVREIALARESAHLSTDERAIESVFFGGGTPTLVPARDLVSTLTELSNEFGLAAHAEVTTEANPDSVDAASLSVLREGGFTRISFGHQSSAASVLKILERTHTSRGTWQAVAAARDAGFEHINIDLIYGSPGETDDDLRRTLDEVLACGADHVSAYSLIVEPGTRLAARVRRGELPMPDDDIAADRYQLIDDVLSSAGLHWYEVSNWARPGGECRHNLGYWRNQDWWGIGPGAHSHVRGHRWWNHKHPATWADALVKGSLPWTGEETVDAEAQEVERIMLGMRLREGLALASFSSEAAAQAQAAVARGLLDLDAFDTGYLVLTRAGRLLADGVIRELTP